MPNTSNENRIKIEIRIKYTLRVYLLYLFDVYFLIAKFRVLITLYVYLALFRHIFYQISV